MRRTSASRWIESRSTRARSTVSRANRVARVFCSFSSALTWARTCGGWVRAAGSAPSVSSSRVALGGVALGAGGAGLLVGDRREVGGGGDRVADGADARRHGDDVAAADAGALVAGEPPGQADVATGRPARRTAPSAGSMPSRRTSRSATASTGGVRSRTWRRPRADGDDDVLDATARRGSRRSAAVGSSSALSRASAARSVRRSASSTIMTRQRPTEGAAPPPATSAAGVLDPDRQPLGGLDRDVGVGAVERGAALAADAAPAVRALQRGGERPGRHRPAGAGRPGEQPRVGHGGRVGRPPGCRVATRVRLSDDVVPDAHDVGSRRGGAARGRRGPGRGSRPRRQRRVDDEVARRVRPRRARRKCSPHRLVEVVALASRRSWTSPRRPRAGAGVTSRTTVRCGTRPSIAHS